ncbi:hypothetical protein ACH4U6_10020 [Streptomyces netropsis]|uniref:hypothetical protein n=1 Tax=Streptomyces netropsis TaxID=55404 RepID=UPI0037AD953E
MTADHDTGISWHPVRATLMLVVLGLAGPGAVLHQQAGELLDRTNEPPPTAMPDTALDGS